MIDNSLREFMSSNGMAARVPSVDTSEKGSKRTLLLFHWFLFSIGLTGIIYGLSWKLHAALLARRAMTEYHDWAVPFFHPNKPQQLIFFYHRRDWPISVLFLDLLHSETARTFA